MIQGTERSYASAGRQSSAIARLRVLGIVDEIAIGSSDLMRLAMVGIALALQSLVMFSPGHFRPASSPWFAIWVTFAVLGSLIASAAAAVPLRPLLPARARVWLGATALAGLAILSIVGAWEGTMGVRAMLQGTPYGNDGAAMDSYAAQQVRHGHDPYVKTNIVSALAAIDAPAITVTPLMRGQFGGARAYPSEAAIEQAFMSDLRFRSTRGVPTPPEFESKYNYPAGSFLFILPFFWLGIHDMRFLYALAVLAMGGYLWYRMPRSLRPLIPLVILSDVPLVVMTTSGQPDPVYGLFLLIALAEWPSSRVSPVAFGLAIATKQLAWFFVPLYVILIVRRLGWREARRRIAIMSAIFLVVNGPFIVWSPLAYVSSVAGPMSDPMFPLGVGAIALFVGNVLPMMPKVAFTVAEMLAWVGGSVAYARTRWIPPAAIAAFAALPLFFAWRSLMNYFYLVPLFALAVALADASRSARPVESVDRRVVHDCDLPVVAGERARG